MPEDEEIIEEQPGGENQGETTIVVINPTVNNTQAGSIQGTGSYTEGEKVTLTAVPEEGFKFLCWNDGNLNPERTLVAGEDTVPTRANFVSIQDGFVPITKENLISFWEAIKEYIDSKYITEEEVLALFNIDNNQNNG